MQLLRALPLALLLLAGACQATGSTGGKSHAELEAELLQVDRDFCALAQKTSIGEAFRAFLAEDATSMPLSKPFVHGRGAIAESLAGTPEGDELTWTPQFARASAAGDLGYTYGTWTYTTAGTLDVLHGKYVTIWKRQEDGTWKAVFDGGNALDESSGPVDPREPDEEREREEREREESAERDGSQG